MQAPAGNKLNLPKKIEYLEASVIECHDRVSPTPGGRVVPVAALMPGIASAAMLSKR
jgi:hypothetical protein